MSEEIAALYDTEGRQVGSAPRSEVRAKNLHHAATAVVVFDRAGRVFVHQRTESKDVYPGLFDFAAGGVLQDGEDPWEAAERELAEELGLSDPLNRIGEGEYADPHTSYHGFLAWALTDDEPTLQAEEVQGGAWWPREELLRALKETPESFMPDTVGLLGEWLATGLPDLRVRRATRGDLAAVRSLCLEYQGDGPALGDDVFARRYTTLQASSHHLLLLAELDGIPVGYALAQDYGPGLREDFSVGRFHDLYVSHSARRAGVGQKLVNAVAAWAATRGAFILDWQASPGAVAFYERLGYEADRRGDFADYPGFCVDTRTVR
ncbi:MAG: GNAT family N-acetyltransferase [Arthrobacter sp.]|jgi:8-oxo-dGTP pyrophosphatase MutT (NUDIX family)/GNAT superfamily N-acetyltransferase|nr:GNAT family N-acetyltransferase [Arthrobacter sp.]